MLIEQVWNPANIVFVCQDQDSLSVLDEQFCMTANAFSTNIDAILKPLWKFLGILIEEVWNPS